jgi:hypothetical protein
MTSILRFFATGLVATLAGGFALGMASADSSNTQTASNSAQTAQVATAISGDATSNNSATATSGGAVATSYLSTVQAVLQKASNKSDNCDCVLSNSQDGANALVKSQQATAVTGIASADNSSTSTTGEVAAILEEVEQQIIEQLARNKALVPVAGEEPPGEEEPPADEEPPAQEEDGEEAGEGEGD